MNLASWIILGLLVLVVALALRSVIRGKGCGCGGRDGCGCDESSCATGSAVDPTCERNAHLGRGRFDNDMAKACSGCASCNACATNNLCLQPTIRPLH